MPKYADRMSSIQPFIVMEVLEKVLTMRRQGQEVIHLEIGEPDFGTPSSIIENIKLHCNKETTRYTHSKGKRLLREAIVAYRKKRHNYESNPEEYIITAGTSPGFLISIGALINPGDEVIITNPYYPCYPNFINFFGGIPKYVNIMEENAFILDPNEVERVITPKTKMIILNSPSNPTGQIIPMNFLKQIADISINNDLWVLSDEIYAELTYQDQVTPSILDISEMNDRTILLDGFSKYWAMTGWRLGYIKGPINCINEINKLNQNFLICAPNISQEAGIAALQCSIETQVMLDEYRKRRDFIYKRINEIDGLSMVLPSGAFYAFINIQKISHDSYNFVMEFLEKYKVATIPGISFGKNGEGYIRLSYCNTLENIKKGLDCLEHFVQEKKKNL